MPKHKKRGTSTKHKTTHKTTHKKTRKTTKTKKSPSKSKNLERVLIENFVSFQKVMVNLYTKFDNLSQKISKLLELFEISAKTLAEKDLKYTRNEEAKEILNKMNMMLDQNKTIARGLTLMHEMITSERHETPDTSENVSPRPQTPPKQIQIQGPKQMSKEMPVGRKNLAGYQKSIQTKDTQAEAESESTMEQTSNTERSSEEENE